MGDLRIADGRKRRCADRGGERHRKRLALDDELRERSHGRGIALVVGDRPQRIGADRAGLHQHVSC